ncbi:MAG: PAS domain-containing protein [Chitinophagaceae bacterium]|nr:MAG: PAS domain-containing protein [Chitinophagaceae bacterium]
MKNTPINHGTYAVPEFLQGITDLCALLVDGNPDPVLAIDKEYRIVLLNKAGEHWLGRTRSAALNHNLFSLLPALGDSGVLEALDGAMRRGSEGNPQTTSGDQHYQWYIRPMTDKFGARLGALCLLRDITQLVRAEQRASRLEAAVQQKDFLLSNRAQMAETIIDASRDLILVLDRELRICAGNKALQQYSGLHTGDLVGHRLFDVFPQLAHMPFADELTKAFAGTATEIHGQPCLVQPGTCHISITPLMHGDVVYGVLVVTEVFPG